MFDRALPQFLDDLLMPELAEDYFGKCDVQAISGNGTMPQLLGVAEAGVNKPEWNEAEPKLAGLQKAIAYCKWLTWTKRFLPPNLLVMNPRTWAWIEEQKDEQKRPIILPHDLTPAEALALTGEEGVAEGPVAKWMGLLVVLDSNVPVTLGSGKDQTACIVQRAEDSWWLENPEMRVRAYEQPAETASREMVIRCQAFNYCSLSHERHPEGISYLTGTGLKVAAPTV